MGITLALLGTLPSAYTSLSRAAVSRAAPTLSAVQQVGGSLGSALLVAVLSQRLGGELERNGMATSGGGSDQITSMPPDARDSVAPLWPMPSGQSFWVAFGITAVVLLPALYFPRKTVGRKAS